MNKVYKLKRSSHGVKVVSEIAKGHSGEKTIDERAGFGGFITQSITSCNTWRLTMSVVAALALGSVFVPSSAFASAPGINNSATRAAWGSGEAKKNDGSDVSGSHTNIANNVTITNKNGSTTTANYATNTTPTTRNSTAIGTNSLAWGGANATATNATAWGYGASADYCIDQTTGLRKACVSGDTTRTQARYFSQATGIYSTAWAGGRATGMFSTAFGGGAWANGVRAVAWSSGWALGADTTAWGRATASGNNATAWGSSGVLASGDNSTAWGGANVTASGNQATAFGDGTTAYGNQSTAFGNDTYALGHGATAWGVDTNASGDKSTAFGRNTLAKGDSSVAFGLDNNATGANSLAGGGRLNVASGYAATALGGRENKAIGERSATLGGRFNIAKGDGSVVLGGEYNEANATNSVAWGFGSITHAGANNSTAFGANSHAYGANSLAAIGGTALGENSIAMGAGATANKKNTYAIGKGALADKENTIAFGENAKAQANRGIAIGMNSDVANGSAGAIAIGSSSYVGGKPEHTINGQILYDQNGNLIVVKGSSAQGVGAVAIGSQSVAEGDGGEGNIAIGYMALAKDLSKASDNAGQSTAIGTNAKAIGSQSMALGANAVARGYGSISIGGDDIGGATDNTGEGNKYSLITDYINFIGGNNNVSKRINALQEMYNGDMTASSDINSDWMKNDGYKSTEASGLASLAIGQSSEASNTFANAIGFTNEAYGIASNAYGVSNKAHGKGSIAFGLENKVYDTNSSAIGVVNIISAGSENSMGLGNMNQIQNGDFSIAAGYYNLNTDDNTITVGLFNRATSQAASAVGIENNATGFGSIAVGGYNSASGTYSTAFGLKNDAAADFTLVIGSDNNASASHSMALGADNNTTAAYSVAAGMSNVAEGEKSAALGFGNVASADRSFSVGMDNNVTETGVESIAHGYRNVVTGSKSIAMGSDNNVSGNNSGAFGDPSQINTDQSYKVGNDSYFGKGAKDGVTANDTTSNNLFSLGNRNVIGNSGNTKNVYVVGSDNEIDKLEHVYVLGSNVKTALGNSVFLGNESAYVAGDTTAANGEVENATVGGVTYGDFAGAQSKGVVSVGDKDKERRIQNVAAGLITKDSTDAINGSQLYAAYDQLQWQVGANTDIAGTVGKPDKNTNRSNVYFVEGNDGIKITAAENASKKGYDVTFAPKFQNATIKNNKIVSIGYNGDIYSVAGDGVDTNTTVVNKDGSVSVTTASALNAYGGREYILSIANQMEANRTEISNDIKNFFGGETKIEGNKTIVTNLGGTGETTIHDAIKKAYDRNDTVKSGDQYVTVERDRNGAEDGNDFTVKVTLPVQYTDDTNSTVTLTNNINNNPVKITNLAPGEADTDAVNVSQLKKGVESNRTKVTVNGGTEAGIKGAYTGGNLKLTHGGENNNTYDLKLANNLTIG
ncbi:hypothetical protein OFO03_07905, partial [Campylobacter sp. JMF_02 ED1]|uniref:hypothetical protein n=1 Tax=unclassified Campylobacter TaxID=2593542 RepID=UPI0022EA0C5D